MRSASPEAIDQFWSWFAGVAPTLGRNAKHPSLLGELDTRIRALNPNLSWEVGPGIAKAWQLVVSPNLNRDLRPEARRIVARAPSIADWEFHAARQPKTWDYRFEVARRDAEPLRLNASSWTFVLLRHPDGAHEVLLKGDNLPALTDDERWQAGAVTLESMLGEDVMMDRIDDFELVDQLESRFAQKERSIRFLPEAVTGSP